MMLGVSRCTGSVLHTSKIDIDDQNCGLSSPSSSLYLSKVQGFPRSHNFSNTCLRRQKPSPGVIHRANLPP
jgi:hypothetical protein